MYLTYTDYFLFLIMTETLKRINFGQVIHNFDWDVQ